MRYDEIYATISKRAVEQANLDLESFTELAIAAGMTEEALRDALLDDLETGGPIFGRFIRGMESAADAAVSTAVDQGNNAGMAHAEKLISRSELDIALDSGDPEDLAEIEAATEDRLFVTWIATLTNTCHLCLPLHGVTLTRAEWKQRGLDPSTVHPGDWGSRCKCRFVLADEYKAAEGMAPLRRVKLESATGIKGNKRTRRAIAQGDLDKALEARDKAMQSLQGRRTLRLMGVADRENK